MNIKNDQLEELYNTKLSCMFTYGCRLSRDKGLVLDCIHDVFLELACKQDISNILNWEKYLLKSLKHRILYVEKQNKMFGSLDEITYLSKTVMSQEEILIEEEDVKGLKERLRTALGLLTSKQKEAIYLRFIYRMSYDEIGDRMGIKAKSAQDYVSSALAHLKNLSPPVNPVSSSDKLRKRH